MTEIPTDEGKLYLSTAIDLFSVRHAAAAFDLGDSQDDQAGIVGWLLVRCGRQDRGGSVGSGAGCGDGADSEGGHGEHDVS